MDPRFTILLPIVRPPMLLPFAVQSVLTQTWRDFELFIICDGAPAETIAAAQGYAARDPRIRVFVHPKGERHGEAHRHADLQQSRGRYIAHIGDDDLWFPDHLEGLAALLDRVDFGATLMATIEPDGACRSLLADLGEPRTRNRMLNEQFNAAGLSTVGYRLAAYQRLPVGWSPAPLDVWTDLYMWRKFLVHPGITFGTRFTVSTVHLSAEPRRRWPLTQRAEEIRAYAARLLDPVGRETLRQTAMQYIADVFSRFETDLHTAIRVNADLRAELARLSEQLQRLTGGPRNDASATR